MIADGDLPAAAIPDTDDIAVAGLVQIVDAGDIAISLTASGGANEFEGLVGQEMFLGEQRHIRLLLEHDRSIDVKLFARMIEPLSGTKVYFRCNPDDVLIFPGSTAGPS